MTPGGSVPETQPDTGNGSADGGVRVGYAGLMRGYRRFYFVLFYLSVIIEIAGFALYHRVFADDRKSAYQIALIIVQVSPAILASSAFLGYSITEGVKMIADMVMDVIRTRRERRIQKAVEKAVAEALEEAADWNRRRMDAAARGEPFDEPFPYLDGEQGENGSS